MTAHHRSVMPLVFSLVLLGPLAIDIFLPSLPDMATVFSATDSDIQMTISLFMIAMGVGQLLVGSLSDRYGRRVTALLGTALYTLGSICAALSSELNELYIARLLQGAGSACCFVTAFAWIRDQFNAYESGKWLSYLGGIIGFVPTLAPMLGGILSVHLGWQASFVFMALLGSMLFLLSYKMLQRTEAVDHKYSGRTFLLWKEILTKRQFLVYSFTGMLTMGAILTYVTNAPFVAMTIGSLNEFGFAMAFGALGLVQFICSFLAPRLVGYIGRRKTISTGCSLVTLSALCILIASTYHPLSFFPAAAVGTAGFSLIFGTSAGLVLERFKHCSGLASSLDGFIRMVGGGFIVLVVELTESNVFTGTATAYGLLCLALILNSREILLEKRKAIMTISLSRFSEQYSKQ